MRQFFLSIIAICGIVMCYGQSDQYKATVLLDAGDISIEGINVRVRGAVKSNTSTNFQGTFIVRDAKYPFKVTLSHKNYIKTTFKVNSAEDNVFRISRSPKNKSKGQTGPSTNVKFKESDSEASLIDRLRTIPGVTVTGGSIKIRGASSINLSSDPLIILDGSRFGGTIFDISLSPSEIKSVRVLKGADASQYGMVGATGVIVITTKTGR